MLEKNKFNSYPCDKLDNISSLLRHSNIKPFKYNKYQQLHMLSILIYIVRNMDYAMGGLEFWHNSCCSQNSSKNISRNVVPKGIYLFDNPRVLFTNNLSSVPPIFPLLLIDIQEVVACLSVPILHTRHCRSPNQRVRLLS